MAEITPINMSIKPTIMSPNRFGFLRLALGFSVILLFGGLLFQYMSQTFASRSVVAFAIGIKSDQQDGGKLKGDLRFQKADQNIRKAITGDPLNQKIIDSALVIEKAQNQTVDHSPWISTLRKLGWRDTGALQTLINDAIQREDLSEIEIIADAMLRRKVLEEQAGLLMSLMETDPAAQKRILAKLEEPAPWRSSYLQRTGSVTVPAIIDARFQTLRTLQESGDPLIRQEFANFVNNLISIQRLKEAEKLWLGHTSARPAAIHDGNFKIAMSLGADEPFITPFDWLFHSGNGYSADVSDDGLGGVNVYIRWDGRGVPVFMNQLTAAKPGHYRITTQTNSNVAHFSRSIDFKLRCGGDVTNFENRFDIRKKIIVSESKNPVECSFPRLDISGRIADRRIESEFSLSSINMIRIRY